MIDTATLLTGLWIFAARICDVALGTVRTIVTVQGKSRCGAASPDGARTHRLQVAARCAKLGNRIGARA